jgi:hypothetical protein
MTALGDMDYWEEAPDLSGNVEILSYRAVFNGPYSSVYRGKLKQENELVRILLVTLLETLNDMACKVAIKVLNAIYGAPLHTIQRVRDLTSCIPLIIIVSYRK